MINKRDNKIVVSIIMMLVLAFLGIAHVANAQRAGYVEKRVDGTSYSAFANQLAPDPATGMCLQADVGNRTVWGPCGSLPSGTPGQVAGIKTVTVSTTTTGTATATASATAYQAVNGTLYAGSNVTLSKGTSTATSTAVDLADGPTIHAASSSYSFSTVTPLAVGTSGSVGTKSDLSRSDHIHQGDGNDKVRAYDGYTPGYLYDTVFSSTGSITVGLNSQKLNLTANFGSSANTVCQGNDSRLSNARTPTAHASTHITGGTDVIANAVASGASGLMTGADKAKLDSTTTTPTAYSIPATGSTKYLNTWIQAASASVAGLLSTTHYNLLNGVTSSPTANRIPYSNASGRLTTWIDAATTSTAGLMSAADKLKLDSTSATPMASVIPVADGSGTLNSWVNGQLVSSTKYTTDSNLVATYGGGWSAPDTFTFTATGTKYRVRAMAYLSGTTSGYGDTTNRVCGLAILADTGSSASTTRDVWWNPVTFQNQFSGLLHSGWFFLSAIDAEATFTLGSTGTVTLGLSTYQLSTTGAECRILAGDGYLYVDIYD